MNPSVLEHSFTNALKEGKWDNLFDGDRSTYAWTNEAQQNGDYLIIDLGATVALYDVKEMEIRDFIMQYLNIQKIRRTGRRSVQ